MILHLIVWDADTGNMLYETERPMWKRDMQEDLIERCRLMGLNRAYKLVFFWRAKGYSNAFANVDCEWHRGSPS